LPRGKPALQVIEDVLVRELGLVSTMEFASASEASRKDGTASPWDILCNAGKLTTAQCRALAMAQKGYMGMDVLRGALTSHATSSNPMNFRVELTSGAQKGESPSQMTPSPEHDPGAFPSIIRSNPRPATPAATPASVALDISSIHPPAAPPKRPPQRGISHQGLVGKTLGRFQIISQLGRGASGCVYLAHHLTLAIPVAVKVLSTQLAMLDARHIDRFQHEARASARLSHPNIVRVLDFDQVDGLYLIVMEYIDGMTVGEQIALSGPMTETLSLIVAKGVAEALEAAHMESIIHRDVKPANIMLTKNRRVKLADLGLAKALGLSDLAGETGENTALGTPYYFSPEQARDAAHVDHRADIYSLGCTMFHMLAGHVPYQGNRISEVIMRHEMAPIPDLQVLRPDVQECTSNLIRWMMAKKPEQRPLDYPTLINSIQQCIVEEQVQKTPNRKQSVQHNSSIFKKLLTNILGEEPSH